MRAVHLGQKGSVQVSLLLMCFRLQWDRSKSLTCYLRAAARQPRLLARQTVQAWQPKHAPKL